MWTVGQFGVVFKGILSRDGTQELVAVKTLKGNPNTYWYLCLVFDVDTPFSGVARILIRGALKVNYGREVPEKFWPEATPTNYDVIIAVSGGRNYIERESSCPAT